ncbi:hypothetical protein C8R45DRAFT_1180679 [Mycena sanguinolenta]|nr:hypothetical protein C8R45DRAFT_1180679 [Mycena sanguinolenta]
MILCSKVLTACQEFLLIHPSLSEMGNNCPRSFGCKRAKFHKSFKVRSEIIPLTDIWQRMAPLHLTDQMSASSPYALKSLQVVFPQVLEPSNWSGPQGHVQDFKVFMSRVSTQQLVLPPTVSKPLRSASACIKPVSVCLRPSAQPPSKPFLVLLNPHSEWLLSSLIFGGHWSSVLDAKDVKDKGVVLLMNIIICDSVKVVEKLTKDNTKAVIHTQRKDGSDGFSFYIFPAVPKPSWYIGCYVGLSDRITRNEFISSLFDKLISDRAVIRMIQEHHDRVLDPLPPPSPTLPRPRLVSGEEVEGGHRLTSGFITGFTALATPAIVAYELHR